MRTVDRTAQFQQDDDQENQPPAPGTVTPPANPGSGQPSNTGGYGNMGSGMQYNMGKVAEPVMAAQNMFGPPQRGAGGIRPPNNNITATNPANTSDPSALWANMMADHDASLEGKIQGTYADEALNQRRMSEMNAVMGGGVGGAFAGGTAQVALGGQQNRLQARNDHTKQGLELKMARLQQLIRQAEAAKDRDLQRELQAEADKTQLAIAGMATGEPMPEAGMAGADESNIPAEIMGSDDGLTTGDYASIAAGPYVAAGKAAYNRMDDAWGYLNGDDDGDISKYYPDNWDSMSKEEQAKWTSDFIVRNFG